MPTGVPWVQEVEVTEADTGLPNTTEGALELSKARLAKAGNATPPAAQPEVEEQPEEAQAAAEDGEEAKPDGQPAEPNKADFSFVADPAWRADLEKANLSPDAAKKFKDFQAEFTRKSQQLAKAAEWERKASAWEALEGIPGAKAVIAQLIAKAEAGDAGAEQAPEDPDLTQADNKAIWAAIRAEAKKLARSEAEALLREQIVSPAQKREAILSVPVQMWHEDNWKDKLPEADFQRAWLEARRHYGDEAFTPENTKALFEPFVKQAALESELAAYKAKQAKDVAVAKRATSPAGSAVVSAGTRPPTPKAPTGDPKDARAKTLRDLMEVYGWDKSALDAAAK